MEQNYSELKSLIGKNIGEYRKIAGLSQLDLAEKLNYSDKAISKWERGESLPDIIILKQIADIFGITVNDLIGYKDTRKKKIDLKKIVQNKKLLLSLSVGLVWLVATVIFVFMQLLNLLNNYNWLVFVYAISASSIVSIVFFIKWKKTILLTIAESILIWSIAISLCLSILYYKIWLILIIVLPLQILTILWNWFWSKKKFNQ